MKYSLDLKLIISIEIRQKNSPENKKGRRSSVPEDAGLAQVILALCADRSLRKGLYNDREGSRV